MDCFRNFLVGTMVQRKVTMKESPAKNKMF